MTAAKNVHGHGAMSEVAASEKATRQEGAIRLRITEALRVSGGGLTPEGFAVDTGLLLNTVRRRFTDLWKDGVIKWSGHYRSNRRGNPSKVWVLGADPDRSKAPKRATAARVAELEQENERLRERVVELERQLAGSQRSLF